MQKPGVMNRLQSIQQGHDHGQRGLFIPLDRGVRQRLLEAPAFFIGHDHVAGSIAFKVAEDLDDILVAKSGKRLRLAHESIPAPRIFRLGLVRLQCDGAREMISDGDVRREELLDGNLQLKVIVGRQIGDAERSHAENAEKAVLLQQVTCRQGGRQGLRTIGAQGKGHLMVWLDWPSMVAQSVTILDCLLQLQQCCRRRFDQIRQVGDGQITSAASPLR